MPAVGEVSDFVWHWASYLLFFKKQNMWKFCGYSD